MEARCIVASEQQVEVAGRALLARMACRDQSALEEFYGQYHRLVYSFVLKILGCRNEAEEVTLEVFWQAWQQAGQYSEQRGSVTAWLIMMARSRAIDRKRARDRRQGALELVDAGGNGAEQSADASLDPEATVYLLERREAVLAALAEMGDKQRQAIELAFFSGLSQSEIAASLDEPLGTVKTRIRTGMQILREKLKRYL